MRIAITGASGFVGSALCEWIEARGDSVIRVTRHRDRARRGTAYWNPAAFEMDERGFEGLDVVVHLAGENLFRVWTQRRRDAIRRSRVQGTQLLASGLAGLQRPPALLVTASAVGYYGDNPPDQRLDEGSPGDTGFLAGVVRSWEAANEPADVAGIRTVQLRFGIVIGSGGGIVKTVLPAFRLGLGGVAGPGPQAWSWIAHAEIPHIVHHVIETTELRGPVNATTPHPTTSAEFSHTLGRVLNRPVPIHIPEAVIALAPGGMGHDLVIASANVVPARLLATGYEFRHPDLEATLREALQETGNR